MSTVTRETTVHEHKGYKIHHVSHVWYEKIENRNKIRRKREYGAKVAYLFQIENETNARGDSLVWGAPIEQKIKALLPNAKVFADNGWSFADRNKAAVSVHVTFHIKVSKPSEIPDRDAAVASIEKDSPVITNALQGIREALDVKIEELAQKQRRDDADRIARTLAKRANEAAKTRINYEAELAALKTKLEVTRKAELAEQIKQLRDQPPGSVKLDGGREVDQRSIEAAIKHAAEAFPSSSPFSDDSSRNLTKIEEV